MVGGGVADDEARDDEDEAIGNRGENTGGCAEDDSENGLDDGPTGRRARFD